MADRARLSRGRRHSGRRRRCADAQPADPAATHPVPDDHGAGAGSADHDNADARTGQSRRRLTIEVSGRQAMCVLDAEPVAASEARRFIADTFEQWHLTDDLDTVALLTSELVTNGVLHARTPLEVGLTSDERGLLVQVHDSDPRPPTPRGHRANLLADIEELLMRPDASTVN